MFCLGISCFDAIVLHGINFFEQGITNTDF